MAVSGDNKQEQQQQPQQQGRQIPIVCPGHTRPLAELQFCYLPDEERTLLISACHGASDLRLVKMLENVRYNTLYEYQLVTNFAYSLLCYHMNIDRKPMIRDGASGDWIGTFAGHKGAVWSCRVDATGNLAATASGDFSVQVWDAITGKSLYQFPHKHIVKSCDFSPNSKWLATAGHEGILRIFNLLTPKAEPLQLVQDPSQKISMNKICWLTNEILCVGCGDGAIRFWQIPQDVALWTTNPPTTPIHIVRTDDGVEIRDMEITDTTSSLKILTVASGSKVHFFNLQDRSLMHFYKMPMHFKDEGGASLHPSGTKFVAGGSDLWVRVFDFATGTQLECLKGHHGPIRCLRYSPDGNIYASGSEDGTIRLWKTCPDEE
jgi:serine-threonine kinase receptor-associated protein